MTHLTSLVKQIQAQNPYLLFKILKLDWCLKLKWLCCWATLGNKLKLLLWILSNPPDLSPRFLADWAKSILLILPKFLELPCPRIVALSPNLLRLELLLKCFAVIFSIVFNFLLLKNSLLYITSFLCFCFSWLFFNNIFRFDSNYGT